MKVATAPSPPASPAVETPPGPPRLWGLDVRRLHDAWWHARGVQCVHRGRPTRLQRGAELFLLLEPGQLVLFDAGLLSDRLMWNGALVTRLRIVDEHDPPYGERVILDDEGRVERIARRYTSDRKTSGRAALTSRRRIAGRWAAAATRRDGSRLLRRTASWSRLDHVRMNGVIAVEDSDEEQRRLLDELVARWSDPGQSIDGIEEIAPGVWASPGTVLPDDLVAIGPLWLGSPPPDNTRCLVGPDWVPDADAISATALRPIAEVPTPDPIPGARVAAGRTIYPYVKRAMDVTVSLAAILLVAPIFLLFSLAIVLEDGRPVFFNHRRQGRGGRPFDCIKFRTMHRNAEKIARDLEAYNVCDGPQVYIRDDPRVTRVGRLLRSSHLDELPQFWNVLVGDMSLVGPRPSPDDENRFCPAWRDARLSVRPGISGLWQLERTRRPGEDFQEWIRYDLEYVKNASLRLDLEILSRTVRLLIRGKG